LTCGFLQVFSAERFATLTSFAVWIYEHFPFRRFRLLSVGVWVKRGTFL